MATLKLSAISENCKQQVNIVDNLLAEELDSKILELEEKVNEKREERDKFIFSIEEIVNENFFS